MSASLWFLQGDSLEFWFKTTAEHAETTGAPCFFICGWSCEALTWVQTLMCTVVCPKTVQDNYIARSEAWANLLCCKSNWPTKQLSWHAHCCHSAGSPVQLSLQSKAEPMPQASRPPVTLHSQARMKTMHGILHSVVYFSAAAPQKLPWT